MGGGPSSFQRASVGVGAGAGGVAPNMMHYGNPAAGFPSQQRAGLMGAGAGMGMRPAGVGAGVGPAGPTGGKIIPDVRALGAAGGAGGWQQRGQEKAQQAEAPKAPDSFSFVMDAMQDSIK